MKKAKFPYDYKSVALSKAKGSATFIGEPTPELLEAINRMAEIASKKILKDKKCPKHGIVYDYINGHAVCPVCG